MRAIAQASRAVARAAMKSVGGFDPATFDTNRGWMPLGAYGGEYARPAQIAAAISAYGGTNTSSSTVFSCVTLIADTLAGYESSLVNADGEPITRGATDEDLFQLLEEPSPGLTYSDFVADMETDVELVGNSYWLKEDFNGLLQPRWMQRFQPSQVKVATNNRDEKIGYVVTVKGIQIAFGLEDIIHFRTRNPLHKHYGMGVVEAILRELNLDIAQTTHITSFFTNGARIAGVLTVAEEMDDKQYERLKRQVDEQYGGPQNAYRTLIAEKATDFKPIQHAPNQLGVVDLAKLTEDKMLKAFGVPGFMLGGLEEGGVPKMEQSQHVFFRRMLPRSQRFQDRLTLDLVGLWEGHKFAVFPDANEPPAVKYANGGKLAQAWGTVNEVRVATGNPEVDDPRFDIPVPPNTVLPQYVMSAIPGPGQVPGRQPGLPGGGGGNEPDPPPTEHSAPDVVLKFKGTSRNVMKRVPGSPLSMSPGRPVSGIPEAVRAALAELGRDGQKMLEAGQVQALLEAPADPPIEMVEAPELPEGYELRTKLIDPGQAEAALAQALLNGQATFFFKATPRFNATFVDFFNQQRNRVLDTMNGFKGASARARGNGSDKKELESGDDLWHIQAEDDALLAAYLAVVDDLGPAALLVPNRLANSTLTWDVQHEFTKTARDKLASLVVRVNETTRSQIAEQVEVGLKRGYSIPRIANGFQDEGYTGIRGVFDTATTARAEVIARSETAMMFNAASSASFRAGGIEEVDVFDGTGDAGCADAAGQRWSLDKADDNLLEHPNCVRAFAPVVV